MNLKSIFKTIVRAAPVIIAHAPAVIAAVRDVKRAAKKPASRRFSEGIDPDLVGTPAPER